MEEIKYSDITLILPTLNEEQNIELILDKLTDFYNAINIIVVDDNSSDNTQELVNSFSSKFPNRFFDLKLIRRGKDKIAGLTASVLDGVGETKTKFFAVMDADLQHPPEILREMYSKLLRESADLVVGARRPFKEQQGLHRVIITYISTQLAHLILRFKKKKVTDPMSGLFIVKTDIIKETLEKKELNFELSGYKVLFDFLKSTEHDLKILNCAYDFGIRPQGKSKLKPKHAFYFFRSLFKS